MRFCTALAALMGLAAVVLDAAPIAAETITFEVAEQSSDSITLTAELTRPAGDGLLPAVVMLHGCNGIWRPWGDNWSERLVRWGYVALQVDSFGPRGLPDGVCNSPLTVGARARAADAHAAKAYLAGLPYVDPGRIAVIGMSHGGWAALSSAQNTYLHDTLRAEPFKAAVALYPHCEPQLYRLDAPLLILIGEVDDWTFSFRCEGMELIGPTRHAVTLKVYPDATHAFDVDLPDQEYLGHVMKFHAAASQDSVTRVQAFLAKHLGGG